MRSKIFVVAILMVMVALPFTAWLPAHLIAASTSGSSQADVTVYVTPAFVDGGGGGGGSGGGGGGGGGATDDTRITSFGDVVTDEGLLFDDVEVYSLDNMLRLDILRGTTVLNKYGSYMPTVRIKTLAEPPAVPENIKQVGLVYELLPEGAKFDPPISLTIEYEADELPEEVSENSLYIAKWNESNQEWIELESIVNTATQIVSTEISGFSIHALMASSDPASFSIADLSITPGEVQLGESLNVNVSIINNGDLTGSYEVHLQIDEITVQTKEVTLAGGDSEAVVFTITPDAVGEHLINVGGLSGTYEVRAPKVPANFITSSLTVYPQEVSVGEEVGIKVNVTNTGELPGTYKLVLKVDDEVAETREITLAGKEDLQVTFTLSRDVPGSHVISIDALSRGLRVYPQAAPPEEAVALPPTTPEEPPAETAEPPEQKPVPITLGLWVIAATIAAGLIGGIGLMAVIRLRRY